MEISLKKLCKVIKQKEVEAPQKIDLKIEAFPIKIWGKKILILLLSTKVRKFFSSNFIMHR